MITSPASAPAAARPVPTRLEVLDRLSDNLRAIDVRIKPEAYANLERPGVLVDAARLNEPHATSRDWSTAYDDMEWQTGPYSAAGGAYDLSQRQLGEWLKDVQVLGGVKSDRTSTQAAKVFQQFDRTFKSGAKIDGYPYPLATGLFGAGKTMKDMDTAVRIHLSDGATRTFLGRMNSSLPEAVRTATEGAWKTSAGWDYVQFQEG